MSQTPETPTVTEAPDFTAESRKAYRDRIKQGASAGPTYNPGNVSLWADQIFEYDITPSGSVTCENVLRAGATSQALSCALVASMDNAGTLTVPKNGTITFEFEISETEDGTFQNIGPTICLTAPEGGMTAKPGDTLCRVALPDFPLPWLKLKLTFTGSISGGTLAAGLAYAAR